MKLENVKRVCPTRKRARAVSQRLILWDGIDQGEMKCLMLRSLFVEKTRTTARVGENCEG